MTFDQLEKSIREYIAQNMLTEAIQLLSDYFKDDADLDEITIQSANYNAIVSRQIKGLADMGEVDLALNKLRANILQFLRSKKEYLKYKTQTFGETETGHKANTDKIKVFFSVGSPHTDEQQNFINKIVQYFDENGIVLETLKEWNDNDPLLPIMKEIKNSCGCFVLALERIQISEGIEKRGSDQESKIVNTAFASPWLHIEAALARSMDMPLIIFKDQSLKNEGLIHDNKQEWGIVRVDQANIHQIGEYPIKNFILSWINQVKKYAADKQGV